MPPVRRAVLRPAEDVRRALSAAYAGDPGRAPGRSSATLKRISNWPHAGASRSAWDTGLTAVFLELGQGSTSPAAPCMTPCSEGVRRGYTRGYLRKFRGTRPHCARQHRRQHAGDHLHGHRPGDALRVTVAPKGAGSENNVASRDAHPRGGAGGGQGLRSARRVRRGRESLPAGRGGRGPRAAASTPRRSSPKGPSAGFWTCPTPTRFTRRSRRAPRRAQQNRQSDRRASAAHDGAARADKRRADPHRDAARGRVHQLPRGAARRGDALIPASPPADGRYSATGRSACHEPAPKRPFERKDRTEPARR